MISFIIPTIGRKSLLATLRSIETRPGDEIIIVGNGVNQGLYSLRQHRPELRLIDCPPGGDWGHTERNFAMLFASCPYIAHIDDDDYYVDGTRALMADAIENTPNRPIIFRMQFPNGITLWQTQEIRCGNLGTPCFLHPNTPEKLGRWGSFVGGDCAFLESSKWTVEEYVWREEVIALLGHN